METETYRIKTPTFEGPFGLLLDLVEKRKLFINDVSLAAVTEEYLKYINTAGNIHHSNTASFIVVAATLILIKSKSLLPNLDLTGDEEGDIKNLEERLRLYELFTRLSLNVKKDFGKRIIFPPNERKSEVLVFLPDDQITRESMMTFAKGVLGAMPKKIFLPEVEVKKVVSIEEMLERITERVKNAIRMSFKDNFGGDKVEMIVGFLAMLELVRQGMLDANQENNDIIISKLEITKQE